MKKLFFALFLGLSLLMPHNTLADSFDFMINPILSDNQDENITDYYSIKVNPGDEKEYQLLIVNNSSSEVTYQVRVNNASTTSDGRLDYSSKDSQLLAKDSLSIKDLLTVPKKITVAGQSSDKISITMKAPKQAFDGAILGGVSVVALGDTEKSDKPGISLQNNLAMTVPFVVHMTDGKIKPELKLASFKVNDTQAQQAFTLAIDNMPKHVLPKVAITVDIRDEKMSKKVVTLESKEVDFAPQAQAQLNFVSSKALDKGKYKAEVKATSEYGDWKWTEDFEVKSSSNDLNEKNESTQKKQVLWPYILAGFILVIGGLLILLYKLKHKQEKLVEDNKMNRKSRK